MQIIKVMKLSVSQTVAVCIVLAVSFALAVDAIKCRGEGSNTAGIDWFIAMKYPGGTDASGTPGISEEVADRLNEGWAYSYLDPASSKMTGSKYDLTDKKNTALAKTLAPLYDRKQWNSIGWIFYNDQTKDFATTPKSGCGHSKGVLAFDKSGAIWIVHSHPVFPPPPKDGYRMSGSNQFGQSYFCVSLTPAEFSELSGNMQMIQPGIYSSNYPPSLQSLYPDVADILSQKWPKKGLSAVATAGIFTHIAKDSKWGGSTAIDSEGNDFYPDLVAPSLKSPVYVQTWYRPAGSTGRTFPSRCDNPQEFRIAEKINSIQLDPNWPTYASWDDHSKWAISMDQKVGAVCIGDLNFQWSQRGRAGGVLCIRDKKVYQTFKSFVVTIANCDDKAAVTPAFDWKKDDSAESSGDELHVASAEEIAAAIAEGDPSEHEEESESDSTAAGSAVSISPYAIAFVPLTGPVWYNGSFWCGIVIGMFVALLWMSFASPATGSGGGGAVQSQGGFSQLAAMSAIATILLIAIIANPTPINVIQPTPTKPSAAAAIPSPVAMNPAAALPVAAIPAAAADGDDSAFDYYQSIDDSLTGPALFKALQNLIDNPKVPSYKAVPSTFASIDAGRFDCPSGTIGDVYSKKCWSPTSEKCGNYHTAGDCFNVERTCCAVLCCVV